MKKTYLRSSTVPSSESKHTSWPLLVLISFWRYCCFLFFALRKRLFGFCGFSQPSLSHLWKILSLLKLSKVVLLQLNCFSSLWRRCSTLMWLVFCCRVLPAFNKTHWVPLRDKMCRKVQNNTFAFKKWGIISSAVRSLHGSVFGATVAVGGTTLAHSELFCSLFSDLEVN